MPSLLPASDLPHPPASDGQGSLGSRGLSAPRSAAQGSLSAAWLGRGPSRRGSARARRGLLPSEVGAQGGGAQQMWGLTPWGLVSAKGSSVWLMVERGWGAAGLGLLLYGRSGPGRARLQV